MIKKITKLGLGICAFALVSTLLIKGDVKAEIREGETLQVGNSVTALLDKTGVLTISGTGEMWNDEDNLNIYYNKWFDNKKSDIYKIVVKNGVTSIGRKAFSYLENVQSVSLPKTITLIDSYAFQKTTALRKIKIPSSVTKVGTQSFYESGIEKCTLVKGLKEIDDFAFGHCEKLTSVSIPAGVQSVGTGAFMESGVTKVKVGSNVGIIRKDAFPAVKATILSDKVTIGENAFGTGSIFNAYKGSSADEYAKINNLIINYLKDKRDKSTKLTKVNGLNVRSISKGLVLSFGKVKGATGYEIVYASNSALLEAGKAAAVGNSHIIKGLESGKNYYVKVRAYTKVRGKKVFGKYSKVVKARTK